ncbi:MBL fold metallo-hydrolase [Paenibacillus sp. 1P03SA]|uniref:MBL fold metallo-hydrolase n=1 Tax=Paenibacillus sp. 1P03SA TaxID=3132294 RepID=UPI0039A07F76
MKIRLIRNATLWLEYAGRHILVDPMLSAAEANPAIPNTANGRRNPLVPLPVPAEELLKPDLVLVTHLHRDHWDGEAAERLPKDTPVLCQPGDAKTLAEQGFTAAAAVEEETAWGGLHIARTSGRHGTGDIGAAMGPVSGFVLRAEGEPAVYIAGDTIYCAEVAEALERHRPAVTVVNAGGAVFTAGDPITMTADDVVSVCRKAQQTRVIAVHMEAINHCLLTREALLARLEQEGLSERTDVPADGQWLEFAAAH